MRLRCALHVLLGRPLAYRLEIDAPFVFGPGNNIGVVEIKMTHRAASTYAGKGSAGIAMQGNVYNSVHMRYDSNYFRAGS